MIPDCFHYLQKEISPRTVDILGGTELWISMGIGILCVFLQDQMVIVDPSNAHDLLGGLISYASIALGFCLAGLTIAFTIPSERFAWKLKNNKRQNSSKNSFSNLLFVFSWTAIVHLVTVILLVLLLLFEGHCFKVFCMSCEFIRNLEVISKAS